jgi:hypothetical protein
MAIHPWCGKKPDEQRSKWIGRQASLRCPDEGCPGHRWFTVHLRRFQQQLIVVLVMESYKQTFHDRGCCCVDCCAARETEECQNVIQ